jgi:hypothetical protein
MTLEEKLDWMRGLEVGWNGYDGLPPKEETIQRAEVYLSQFCETYRPYRIAPSQGGGKYHGAICFTWHGTENRRAYLEFYDDDDRVYLLLSAPPHDPTTLSYNNDQTVIGVIQSFLQGE